MQGFANAHPNIQITNVPSQNHFGTMPYEKGESKKHALSLGIKNAKYEHLLFIDADCRPATPYWIKAMASGFTKGKSIVLGYGAYEKQNTGLNMIIRFETLLTAVQYFGYAKNHNPYMGVGRNLCYTKSLFKKQGGFRAHAHVNAGDDDLFVNAAATATNTALVYKKAAHTLSVPKKTWVSWFRQKRRHTGVAQFYKPKHQMQLALFYLSQLIFLTLFIPLLFSTFIAPVLVILLIRYAVVWVIMGYGGEKLGEKGLIYFFPLIEIFLVPLQLSIFISNHFSTPKTWN